MTRTPFFASDHHFFHKNIQKFQPHTRRGVDVQDMNRLMIEAHNAKVQPQDTVYFLGDFSFGSCIDTENVLKQLNGHKHLIYGNHDQIIKNNSTIREHFESINDYKTIKVNDVAVVMFHFPMRSWDKMGHGSYLLYGHCHGSMEGTPFGKSMDVGVDTRPNVDMAPWSWDEVHRNLKDREVLKHHERTMI